MRAVSVALLLMLCAAALALPNCPALKEEVVVAIKTYVPFVSKPTDGSPPTGYSVVVMNEIASILNLPNWRFEHIQTNRTGSSEILSFVRNGSATFGLTAITVTPSRSSEFVFSIPMVSEGGLGYARSARSGQDELAVFTGLGTPRVVHTLCYVFIAGVVVGHLMWFAERRDNSDQFPPGYLDGIDDACWWSFVTITTVGYGDKAPVTKAGRVIGMIWMFLGIILMGFFSGVVASVLTTEQAPTVIEKIDLKGKNIGTIKSTVVDLIANNGGTVKVYSDPGACFAALADGDVDAVLLDRPVTNYYANVWNERIDVQNNVRPKAIVVPNNLGQRFFAIAFANTTCMFQHINFALSSLYQSGALANAERFWFDEVTESDTLGSFNWTVIGITLGLIVGYGALNSIIDGLDSLRSKWNGRHGPRNGAGFKNENPPPRIKAVTDGGEVAADMVFDHTKEDPWRHIPSWRRSPQSLKLAAASTVVSERGRHLNGVGNVTGLHGAPEVHGINQDFGVLRLG